LAQGKRGTADRIAEQILAAADEGVPNPSRPLDARIALGPLSRLWTAGNAANISRRKPQSLQTEVISIGGISMGGAGKSPFVMYLAQKLDEAGRNPAILTRGYGRKSRLDVIVPRGEAATVAQTGDEAQMFIRRGVAHVGIGPNRYEVGRKMEQQLHPGVFLLDDGFQHFGLKRDRDIVLIDALDPLGGGMFPLGRLREPISALARATAIVITRAESRHTGIERLIRQHNAKAPIFRSRVVVTGEIPEGPVAAFCGLGQPRTFWRTLDELGIPVVCRLQFPDHHRYTEADLHDIERQAAGAEALVTTEKDLMNLPAGVPLPLTIHCLRIEIEIEDEAELLRHVL
jgi:tetraacyldisaccharide 4'-kinase